MKYRTAVVVLLNLALWVAVNLIVWVTVANTSGWMYLPLIPAAFVAGYYGAASIDRIVPWQRR